MGIFGVTKLNENLQKKKKKERKKKHYNWELSMEFSFLNQVLHKKRKKKKEKEKYNRNVRKGKLITMVVTDREN